ncbi:udp-n-acetylglucosamine--dolichyl-phosphate n-acetylglucosaminephosphotransferase [Quercus suber]|uniref:Udp-n-acetylglucosamine--dolichyl-phosphate n-acetylglucosaminephosphotransferase n=1 Tax=Quercus suber TaxID=58331 RepID=A0AAW0L561_QUESU
MLCSALLGSSSPSRSYPSLPDTSSGAISLASISTRRAPLEALSEPESLGIVVGIVFLVVAILFQYFNLTSDSNWLVEYNVALASICFMTLLGFVDDVLDVPWRVKLLLPSFAALPLLMAYAGHTTIIIPKPLIPYVGLEILDLDTYTYFAGMTMAVVGILGHFSETLLVFFAPQVLNFLLSLPQLSGLVPCPRHRLPRFDPKTGLLTGTNDGTLVNFTLRLLGRKSEKSLCIVLLVFQAIACCLCFALRYFLTGWYK